MGFIGQLLEIASGKGLHNYGRSPSLLGKLTNFRLGHVQSQTVKLPKVSTSTNLLLSDAGPVGPKLHPDCSCFVAIHFSATLVEHDRVEFRRRGGISSSHK